MRVVPLEAFRDKVPFSVAIAAVERGFRALGRGEAALPDPMVLELREQQAEVHVKGAHLAGGRHIVLKVATGFYRNRARGLPSGDGMFLLLDADTGVPAVLLEEHGYLTDFRTAAAVALTLKYLAPKDTHEALLVGAGALARLTARAMLAQMPLARLTLWNRTRERAEGLAKELGQAVETRIAPALESAVRDHRVIVTATASTTPLVMASWVGPGTHVTSVGTGSPEKIELEPALLARADKLVADRVFQTERYGNLHHAIAAGVVTRDKVYAELGDLAAGRLPGRESASEITPAYLLSLHYGMRGAVAGLVMGTVLFTSIQFLVAVRLDAEDWRITVPIYTAYGTIAISVGWLSQQLHEFYGRAIEGERVAVIRQLAVTMRHEVNNALAAILAEGQLLEHDAVLTHPEDKQSLQNILTMARRIQHSIEVLVNVTHAPVTNYVEGVSMIDLKQVTSAHQRPQD